MNDYVFKRPPVPNTTLIQSQVPSVSNSQEKLRQVSMARLALAEGNVKIRQE